MDGVRYTLGDCDIRRRHENQKPKAAAEMDGVAVSGYGVDAAVYIAGDVASYTGARDVVYPGGWFVVFVGGNILLVAAHEIFARNMAFVCNRRHGVFLFRGAIRMHN